MNKTRLAHVASDEMVGSIAARKILSDFARRVTATSKVMDISNMSERPAGVFAVMRRRQRVNSFCMRHMMKRETTEYTAFSPTCPQVQHIIEALAHVGFHLTFTLSAKTYTTAPPLPAQYHFEDATGALIVYLAGKDAAPDGEIFPNHASRFLAYPGHKRQALRKAMNALAVVLAFSWQETKTLPRRLQVSA